MNGFWILLAVLAAGLVFSIFARRGRKMARPVYLKKAHLFSPEERILLAALRQAVGDRYEIFGKIPASDLLVLRHLPERGLPRERPDREVKGYFDFVLCEKPDLSVACVISVRSPGARHYTSQKDGDVLCTVCESAGLPHVAMMAQPFYTVPDLRQIISDAVHREPLDLGASGGRKEPRISGLDDIEL